MVPIEIQSHRLCADTLKVSLSKLFPTDLISVHQAWRHGVVVEKLLAAVDPIRQVHIFTHGDSTRLSLAYVYNDRFFEREAARITSGVMRDHGEDAAVMEGYLLCPNINQGFFSEYYRNAGGHAEPPIYYERSGSYEEAVPSLPT